MTFRRVCTCCGPDVSTCRGIYHHRNTDHWLRPPGDLLPMPAAPPERKSTTFFEPLPSSWAPIPYSSQMFLGPPNPPNDPNYYNVNPDFFGPAILTRGELVRSDYVHPDLLAGHQSRLVDIVPDNTLGISMFTSERPSCQLGAARTITKVFETGLIGSDFSALPDFVDVTFQQVLLRILPNESPLMLVDSRDINADTVTYYSSASGAGAFSLLDADPLWFGVEIAPNGSFKPPETFEDVGRDPRNNVPLTDQLFPIGTQLSAVVSDVHTFQFVDGQFSHSLRIAAREDASRGFAFRASSEVIDITPKLCVPKYFQTSQSINSPAIAHQGAAGPYGTIFSETISRSQYDSSPAFHDQRIGQPNWGMQLGEIDSSVRGQTPMVLGDVTIRYHITPEESLNGGSTVTSSTQEVTTSSGGFQAAAPNYTYDDTPPADWTAAVNRDSLILPVNAAQHYSAVRKHGVVLQQAVNIRVGDTDPVYGPLDSFPATTTSPHAMPETLEYERVTAAFSQPQLTLSVSNAQYLIDIGVDRVQLDLTVTNNTPDSIPEGATIQTTPSTTANDFGPIPANGSLTQTINWSPPQSEKDSRVFNLQVQAFTNGSGSDVTDFVIDLS